MKSRHALLTILPLLILGCVERQYNDTTPAGESPARAPSPAEYGKMMASAPGSTTSEARGSSLHTPATPASAPAPGSNPGGPAVPVARKIIYNASIDVIVEDFARAEDGFRQLMRAQKEGYIADEQITGTTGSQRQGKWTVRVPVGDFEAFLQSVGKLGLVQDSRRNSREVTEQFYDLEGRIKVKKAEEERIVKLLADNTGKLEDIISVERDLTRVRGEIEQLVGSLRLLENLTALTTVTITITERKNYVPPETPTFATMIARTFYESVDRLVQVGKSLVLIVVALAPWLPLIAFFVWLAYRFVRFVVRIGERASAPVAPRIPPNPAGP